MKGDYLGAFEELVLLAVAGLADDAYGVTVQERVERDAERPVSLGAVYAALDRLKRKAYVRSWIGESGQYRGGRRKRHFAITADGRACLGEMRRIRDKMWRSLGTAARLRPDFALRASSRSRRSAPRGGGQGSGGQASRRTS